MYMRDSSTGMLQTVEYKIKGGYSITLQIQEVKNIISPLPYKGV